MQIKDLSQPITSKKLNESLAKNFGYKLKLEQFSDVQLEDVRNRLRTELSQMEMNESYDSILESPAYQKTRALLDVVNQALSEREMNEACEQDKMNGEVSRKKDYSGNADSSKKDKKPKKEVNEAALIATIRQRAEAASIPASWIQSALSRIRLGESDRQELKAELRLRYDLNEAQASWLLVEGEETKAENIIASKDMIDRITGWLEDVAAMKSEQLLELLDSIREQQGSDVAQKYQDAVKPALEAIYTALETSRQGLSQGLAVVSGREVETLGAPVSGGMGSEMGSEMDAALGGELPAGPEGPGLPGGEELPPPSTEAGRMKRESVEYSRKLGMLLSSKKK